MTLSQLDFDLPKAICAQISLGTIYAFIFGVVIFYGINELDAVVNAAGSFPLAEAYAQATGSTAATFGLLLIIFLSLKSDPPSDPSSVWQSSKKSPIVIVIIRIRELICQLVRGNELSPNFQPSIR